VSAAPGAGLVDSLLEATVVGSFTRIGFHVRRRLFDWIPPPALGQEGKVREALPGFSRIVGPFLRTPAEGADTIVWLASAPEPRELSGLFFLDRRPRAKHRLGLPRRPDEAQQAARLWQLCAESTAAFAPADAAS
jgi:hypothetical protein